MHRVYGRVQLSVSVVLFQGIGFAGADCPTAQIPETEVLEFLKEKQGLLEGVVICGESRRCIRT